MKINNSNIINQIKSKQTNKDNKTKADNKNKEIKNTNDNLNQKDQFIKSDPSNDRLDLYASKMARTSFTVDKGTAAHTTVQVNRSAFDKILNETTYGETKWEECGVDDNKRWVVVNGQRFEVEHSAEEKARRKNSSKSLMDYLDESDAKIKERNKAKENGPGKPNGNIEALQNNEEVMKLLGKIFNATSPEGILGALV